jgi:hypothetical protein
MYCISLYLFVFLGVSWRLFVWFRMSPPGNAMCKALHHLAAAAPLLCALGVCKRHQKTLRIGRYWEILRDIERYWGILRVYEYLDASLYGPKRIVSIMCTSKHRKYFKVCTWIGKDSSKYECQWRVD